MSKDFRERPVRRVNPSGSAVWVARVTGLDGRRFTYKPEWNRGKGTFARRGDAQRAIDEYYDLRDRRARSPETVGAYAATWTKRHPRAGRTNTTNNGRVRQVLGVEVDGRRLRDWPFRDLKRRHALALVAHMLGDQGRATSGAQNILRTLSAMAEDAITDEVADVNFVRGVRVRANDPRARKPRKAKRVFGWQRMHAFAAASRAEVRSRTLKPDGKHHYPPHDYEAMLRSFSDTSMRLGEVLPLERVDFKPAGCDTPDCRVACVHFHVQRTAHDGAVEEGTKTDHGEPVPGRVVPCPPTLCRLIQARPARIDTPLLFPTPTGKLFWERNFYRDVWYPAITASGIECTPHEFRHSYLSLLRAEGIDDADLAAIAGHTVETMIGHYTHPLGRSFDRVRELIG
jgi:integrase